MTSTQDPFEMNNRFDYPECRDRVRDMTARDQDLAAGGRRPIGIAGGLVLGLCRTVFFNLAGFQLVFFVEEMSVASMKPDAFQENCEGQA